MSGVSGDTNVLRTVAVAATLGFGIGAVCGAQLHVRHLAHCETEKNAAAAASTSGSDGHPLRSSKSHTRTRSDTVAPPIGTVHSCFSRRNGTPRQGGDLVRNARCVFTLGDGLPRDLLQGLHKYSHAWVLYEFHANTNKGDANGNTRNNNAVKGKVRVPRLDGEPVGALATRTPHRPNAIGLTLGKIISVDYDVGAVVLGGADLVDGTPVLDLKPYVPFCDAVVGATAPGWVNNGRDEDVKDGEPLLVSQVVSREGAEASLSTAYLTSVKQRRERRLASQPIGASLAPGGSTSKGKGKKSNSSVDDSDNSSKTPEEQKIKLATRTPHRPNAIGLTLGKIISVDYDVGAVVLGGADLVDGTPVLDLKPYVPFCDAVVGATAPGWVNNGRDEDVKDGEPLLVSQVVSREGAEASLSTAYLTSVKQRRERRLASQPIGASLAPGGSTSKGKGKKSNSSVDDSDNSSKTPEEQKIKKREAKKKRQAGLAFPDALYESPEDFITFVFEVLQLDMRTARERTAEFSKKKFETYRVILCNVEVEYEVTEVEDKKTVTVIGGTAVDPLPTPGVTTKGVTD